VRRAAAREELLVGGEVAVPERPLLHIARRELPVLGRIGQALAEPAALLALADVEEELHDERVVLGEDALEVVDLLVAPAQDRARHGAVHARHQHVPVEDRDVPAPRGGAMHTPEEVVLRLLLGRHLEGDDLAAARVDAAHDVLHGAVLARGVHALEDDQHRLPALRVEHVLELCQARAVAPELGVGGRLVGVLAGVGGVDATQPHAGAGPDAVVGHGGAAIPVCHRHRQPITRPLLSPRDSLVTAR